MIELNIEELVKEINEAWGNANFGEISKIDVVKMGLLKCASDYVQGHTSTRILQELAMITMDYKLTRKGRAWLWEFFSNGSNF